MPIVDRRKIGNPNSSENRKRFLEKVRGSIKGGIDDFLVGTDFDKIEEGTTVSIDPSDISEPGFSYDEDSGDMDHILSGNPGYNVGDTVKKPESGNGTGDKSEKGKEKVNIVLDKDELMNILFDGMELPNLEKLSQQVEPSEELHRAGYSREGIPARLAIKKTYEQALARSFAEEKEEIDIIEDVDLRYKNYAAKEIHKRSATMFCVVDMSGSMGIAERSLAKAFFYLTYLFLSSKYNKVTIKFIGHTGEAWEMSQSEFFKMSYSGSTLILSAFELVDRLIESDADIKDSNIYICQASDGDIFDISDHRYLVAMLNKVILPKVQALMYLQVQDREASSGWSRNTPGVPAGSSLFGIYAKGLSSSKKVYIGFGSLKSHILHFFKKCFIGASK